MHNSSKQIKFWKEFMKRISIRSEWAVRISECRTPSTQVKFFCIIACRWMLFHGFLPELIHLHRTGLIIIIISIGPVQIYHLQLLKRHLGGACRILPHPFKVCFKPHVVPKRQRGGGFVAA